MLLEEIHEWPNGRACLGDVNNVPEPGWNREGGKGD